MNNWLKYKKPLLVALTLALLASSGLIQESLNRDRDRLGLTRIQPLENAPPVLALTTVALGGFRGLISNALWIRASDLQENDKYFEMAQLADWITKLEPHFVQVWLVQSWNMAYNISVKFKDFPDRWRWVERGIELLRDQGLHYNPNETLIYRELAWFFQHKMGANLDDAHLYYKQEWLDEMSEIFGRKKPDLDELINPKTDDEKRRARLLRDKYKMDPQFMKEVDQHYGPLEWRMPESSAIYWAALGLDKARLNPKRVKEDQLITLRRVIYQSMQTSFQRGRLIGNPLNKAIEFGPNLDIIPHVSAAYEQAADEDKAYHDHILVAHRNFLRDAIYFLYENNRMAEADYWFKYLAKKYPDKPMLDSKPESFPRTLGLDEYAVLRVQEDVGNPTSHDRVKATVEGLVQTSYHCLLTDQDDRAEILTRLAQKILDSYAYQTRMRVEPLRMPSLAEIKKEMLDRWLDPTNGIAFEGRALLRAKLGMQAETVPPHGATNAPPETAEKRTTE